MTAEPVAGQPEETEERRPAGAPPEAADKEAGTAAEAGHGSAAEEAADQVDRDLDELGATKKERDEYLELAQRTRADFDNYRKRVAGDTAAAAARGKAELARELIPAIDNLERALRSSGIDPDRDGGGGSAAEPPSQEVSARDALAHGIALVYRELRGALERAGVESYDPTGEEFDPELHEALTTKVADGAKSGIVLETAARGYRLNGQVLRPARVVVSE
jgi:molecular chaperone GrpE